MRDKLKILVKTGVMINLQLQNNITGIPPPGPIMELSLRLEIIFRIYISEKAIEFIFKVEFKFIFSVFREEKLNGC